MSFAAAVGQLQLGASTGTLSVTTAGFQGKALILFGQRVTDQTAAVNAVMNFGFATSSTSRAATSGGNLNGAATSDTYSFQSNDQVIESLNGSGSVVDIADFIQFTATGFDIDVTDTTNGIIYSYWILGGADMTHTEIVSFNAPTSIGDQVVTTTFPMDLAFFMGINSATVGSVVNGQSHFFGAADKFGGQASTSWFMADAAAAANTSKWQRIDSCINMVGASEATPFRGRLTATSATSFTITWDAVSGASGIVFHALVVKGGSARVGSFSQSTTAVAQQIPIGHLPDGLMLVSAFATANTSPAATMRMAIGAASGDAAEQSISLIDVDAADPTNSDRIHQNDAIIQSINSSATITNEAALTTFDEHAVTPSGGATITWATVDGAANEIWYVSVGAPSGPKLLTSTGVGL